MSDVTVKFDPEVEIEEIKMPLLNSTPEEEPERYDMGVYQQTRVEGIAAPMVRLNDVVIYSDQIIRMELHSNPLPKVDVVINDCFGISRVLDSPKSDNLLVVQVIPPFDNCYKKINLRFYITSYSINGNNIHVHGEYNIAGQHDMVLESFGKKTTYEIVEEIAHRLKLGLASNISGTEDSRYMYCPSKEILTVLQQEVGCGGGETCVLDWWIDYWNYINLVNVYDLYKSTDNETEQKEPIPKIWTKITNAVEMNELNETDPVEIDAVITNHPSMSGSPLSVTSYKMNSTTSRNLRFGTDKTIETYSMVELNSNTIDVVDKDISNDIFKKYEYWGEVFGSYNYLIQSALASSFFQKMYSQTIEVSLKKPQFGLCRGGRVYMNWYECNSYISDTMSDANETISTNADNIDTSYSDSEEADEENGFPAENKWILNKTISGKYYILDSILKYNHSGGNMNWEHTLKLSRYSSGVKKYIDELERLNEETNE